MVGVFPDGYFSQYQDTVETIAGVLGAAVDAGATAIEALFDRDIRRVQVSTFGECDARVPLPAWHATVEGRFFHIAHGDGSPRAGDGAWTRWREPVDRAGSVVEPGPRRSRLPELRDRAWMPH
jgi:hypothetical protein